MVEEHEFSNWKGTLMVSTADENRPTRHITVTFQSTRKAREGEHIQ